MRKPAISGLVRYFVLAWGGTAVWGLTALGDEWRLTLQPSRDSHAEAPVTLPVADSLEAGPYRLTPADGSQPLSAVVTKKNGQTSLTFLAPAIAEPTTFAVAKSTQAPDSAARGVTFVPQAANLEILVDGKPLGVHHVDVGAKPFLYPLIGPTGDSYTRAYPMENVEGETVDHPHQRSFWFTFGKVNDIDFWSEVKNHGTIKETARCVTASGPVLGRLETRDDWVGPDGVKVCEDERVLTVYDTRTVRIIDFAILLKASEGPVVFGDTKEGMFGLRVASSMDVDRKKGGKIRNAEGLEDAAAWGKASPWVDYSGPVNGKTVGIAILNHPQSFRYPTTWHVRTYGLFAANPFGWHDFGMPEKGDYTLAKGDSIWFSYRVILHAGDAEAAKLADQFGAYASVPKFELKAVE